MAYPCDSIMKLCVAMKHLGNWKVQRLIPTILQLTKYFSGNIMAAPEVLGDPQREEPEEIQERYDRVVASSFSALSALLMLYSKGYLYAQMICREYLISQQK